MKWMTVHARRTVRIQLTAILSLAIMLLASACSAGSKAGIIVAGSTSVQPFIEVLAEDYSHLHPDTTIDIQGGGSSSGIKAAETETADIGMSSRDLKGDEKNLWNVEIAKDGLAVIIHPDNPIISLTLNQARDIYAGYTVNWKQLGGPDAKIHVFTREEGSGTRGAFESLLMGTEEITPTALVQDSNGAVRQLIASDPAAIGFISLGLVDERVKALELEGIAATRQNVINGSYKLSRPFLLVSKVEPAGKASEFIDFILSPEGKRLLDAEGLVTLIEGGAK